MLAARTVFDPRAGLIAGLDPNHLYLRLERPFSPDPDEEITTEASVSTLGAHLPGVLELGSRGAMLDRCRMRMRDIARIGDEASPDGRPWSCRLLSFVRRQRWREAAAWRRLPLRLRFRLDTLLAQRVIRPVGPFVGRAPSPSGPVVPRMHYAPSNANFAFLYAAQSQARSMSTPCRPAEAPRLRGSRSGDSKER